MKGLSNKDPIKVQEELENSLNLKRKLWIKDVEGSLKRRMPQASFAPGKAEKLTSLFFKHIKGPDWVFV